MLNKVLFYYPTNSIGGAQLLFAKLAAKLSQDNFQVIVVERHSNFISEYLTSRFVSFQKVNMIGNDKYQLKGDELCILSVSFLMKLDNAFKWQSDNRILFWELHPFAIVESLGLSGFFKNERLSRIHPILKIANFKGISRISSFLNLALKNEGLRFMCGKNLVYNRRFFKISSTVDFLPIPIEFNSIIYEYIDKPKLVITWLGRLDMDKEPLFNALMQDIDLCRVELNVIGSGNAINGIIDRYKELAPDVKFLGYIGQNDLDNHLINTDIGIAIGTSALEFAKRGIASLMMPGVNEISDFGEKKYNWLHNSRNANLSVLLSERDKCITLYDAISEYSSSPKSARANSLNYARDNHSWLNVYDKLKLIIKNNTFTYGQLQSTGVLKINESMLNRSKKLYKMKLK